MKKAIALILLLFFVFTLGISPSDSAAKKSTPKKVRAVKKAKQKIKRRSYRIIRNWPKAGPQPVFPRSSNEEVYKPLELAPKAPPAQSPKLTDNSIKFSLKDFFVEGGYGGGAIVGEFGYERKIKDNLFYSGAVGLGIGSGYSIILIDPVRFTYAAKSFFAGGGLNLAMYSTKVSNILGISGAVPADNLFGIEAFIGKNFDRYNTRLAFSTALGLRAVVGYGF